MKSRRDWNIALVIPAYNEAAALKGVITGLAKAFDKKGYPYKIVVVDDGSKDNTAAVAQKEGAYVIQHILNTGSGGATATGVMPSRTVLTLPRQSTVMASMTQPTLLKA
jgi:glycosyltransferase involved in cell wall biosynthesis